MRHKFSVLLDDDYIGRINSIVVTDKDHFFISIWNPFPDHVEGRIKGGIVWDLKLLLVQLLRIKLTYTMQCKVQFGVSRNPLNCEKIEHSWDIMNNGLGYDEKNKRLFVSKTAYNKIDIY